MERELFDWTDCDELDALCFSYGGVVLNVPIGSYEPGQKFERAVIDFQTGSLEFYDGPKAAVAEFKLGLVVK